MKNRILVVSPVRNEAAHIERVVRAVVAQTLPPERWIVIDDASTDGTLAVLRRLEQEVSFLEVREAPADSRHGSARDRLALALDARNFNRGLMNSEWGSYTHVMKLDGDIELPPEYFQILLNRFEEEPRLGLAGGVIVEPTDNGGLRKVRIPRYHVHGALKCYSKACFTAIGGVDERLGWDTIDETYARMRGFETASFTDLVCIHHRPWGSADGILRGRARHGECAYISHYPLLWVTLRSFKVGLSRPHVVSGVAFLYGYLRAAARRTDQVPDSSYRSFTRRELRRRMLHAVSPAHSEVTSSGRTT
jgi:poly-beta-1,6-N-acetyl-D-glucosamine synthase